MNKDSCISFVGIVIVSLVINFFWFRHGLIMGTGESGLLFYNLPGQLDTIAHAWSLPLLGGSVGILVASIPLFWFLSQLQNLGIPGFLIQMGFFTFLFTVSGLSVFFLTRELFPGLEKRFLYISVFFYWFNPISLVSIWNRFLYNFMVFWTLEPLVLWLFLKGLKQKDYRYALITSFATVVFSYALTSIVCDILMLALLIYTVLFYIYIAKRGRIFYFLYLIVFFTTFVLFNFWWIGQLFSFILSPNYTHTSAEFFSSAGNLYTLQVLSESLGLLRNVFALLHYDFFATGTDWAKVFVLPLISVTSLLFFGLIFWVFIKLNKVKEVIFLGFALLITIFLIKGINPPFGELFQFIFLKFPYLQVFRNPFEKFSLLVPLFMAPLVGVALKEIMVSVKLKILKVILLTFVLALLVFWSYPFLSGLVFSKISDDKQRLVSYETKVPDYYNQANNWLNAQGNNFRFISLPLGGEGMTYSWDQPYSGVELSSTLFDTPNISFNTSVPYFSELATNLIKYQLDENVLSFLPFINAQYIVLRDDIDFKSRKMADPKVVKKNMDQLVSQKKIDLVMTKGHLNIYKLSGQSKILPYIYLTDNLIYSNDYDLSTFSNLNASKLAIIDAPKIDISNVILKPDKTITSLSSEEDKRLIRFPVSNLSNNISVTYQFNITQTDKYRILSKSKDFKGSQYLDGKQITQSLNGFIDLSAGLHELTFVGNRSDFLTSIPLQQSNGQLEQKIYNFNLPGGENEYLINFDYLISSNSLASGQNEYVLGIFEDNSNPDSPTYLSKPLKNNQGQWEHYDDKYTSTSGAFKGMLAFLPFTQNNQSNNFGIQIKNLSFEQMLFPQIDLSTNLQFPQTAGKTSLTWSKVNPSLYNLQISKKDNTKEVLVFSVLFDSGWELGQIKTNQPNNQHFLVNSYANGWIIDRPGDYNLDISYKPESLLIIGKRVSLISIFVAIIVMFIKPLWKRLNFQ